MSKRSDPIPILKNIRGFSLSTDIFRFFIWNSYHSKYPPKKNISERQHEKNISERQHQKTYQKDNTRKTYQKDNTRKHIRKTTQEKHIRKTT